MHKESADKFNTGQGMLFPPVFFPVILHIKGNGIFVHANDAVVADGNPMSIFSKIVDNGLGTVKGFLAVGNPVFFITDV